MQYCKVILNGVPTPMFAHTYESAHYDYMLPKSENQIEISYVEQGEVVVWKDGCISHVRPENTLCVIYNKEDIRCNSKAPLHRHITLGLSVDYEMVPISEGQVIACSKEREIDNEDKVFAILPLDQGFIMPANGKIPNMIREIIRTYANVSTANRLLLTSKIMKLLSEITQECIRQSFISKQMPPGNILSVQKAMQYVSEHIQQRIMVEDIAKAVDLSPGYLSNVFKRVTGQTLMEYINRTKLKLVKELVLNGQMTYSQAGEYVGISDTSYLSRLFRKYLGTTIRELKGETQSFISE